MNRIKYLIAFLALIIVNTVTSVQDTMVVVHNAAILKLSIGKIDNIVFYPISRFEDQFGVLIDIGANVYKSVNDKPSIVLSGPKVRKSYFSQCIIAQKFLINKSPVRFSSLGFVFLNL